jgi:signal peptidase II
MFFFLPVIFTALLVSMDQITKQLAVKHLMAVDSLPFIPGFLNFTYVENKGAAYGILDGGRWFFLVLTAVVLVVIVRYYFKPPSTKVKAARIAMVMVCSGAVGNAIDRFRNGYVVDFIHTMFMDFPVFNVADMCIVCGTFLLAALILFYGSPKAKGQTNEAAGG